MTAEVRLIKFQRIYVPNDDDVDESHEPDAERRLMYDLLSFSLLELRDADSLIRYLPNPDWQGLSPIILTASRQEAGILSIFLWKHMIARCSIQASVSVSSSCGPSIDSVTKC